MDAFFNDDIALYASLDAIDHRNFGSQKNSYDSQQSIMRQMNSSSKDVSSKSKVYSLKQLERTKSFYFGFLSIFLLYITFIIASYSLQWSDTILQISHFETSNNTDTKADLSFFIAPKQLIRQMNPSTWILSLNSFPEQLNTNSVTQNQQEQTLWIQLKSFHHKCHDFRCISAFWISIITAVIFPSCYAIYHYIFLHKMLRFQMKRQFDQIRAVFQNDMNMNIIHSYLQLSSKLIYLMRYLTSSVSFAIEKVCWCECNLPSPRSITWGIFKSSKGFSLSNLFLILLEKGSKGILMIVFIQTLLQMSADIHLQISTNENNDEFNDDHAGTDSDNNDNVLVELIVQTQPRLGFVLFFLAANLGMGLLVLQRFTRFNRYLRYKRLQKRAQRELLKQQQHQIEQGTRMQLTHNRTVLANASIMKLLDNMEVEEEEIEYYSRNVVDPAIQYYLQDIYGREDDEGKGENADICNHHFDYHSDHDDIDEDDNELQTPLLEDFESYQFKHTSRALLLPLSSTVESNNIYNKHRSVAESLLSNINKGEGDKLFDQYEDDEIVNFSKPTWNVDDFISHDPPRERSLCHSVLYESGGIAGLFLFPLFFFPYPILRLEYTGFGTILNKQSETLDYINDMYTSLVGQGLSIGGSLEMKTIVQEISFIDLILKMWDSFYDSILGWFTRTILMMNIFIFPVLSFFLCITIRYFLPRPISQANEIANAKPNDPIINQKAINMFRMIYPIVSTFHSFATLDVFAFSLFLTVPNISRLTQNLFNEVDICGSLISKWGGDCVVIHGVCVAGSWFCLSQAMMMNLFCDMTISEYEELYLMILLWN